jgi:uncharacterized protein YjdB
MVMDRVGKFGVATLMCLAWGVASCGDSTAPQDTGAITLKIVGGNEQTAVVGEELPEPLVVKATDDRGKPLRRYLVNFVVAKGDGSVYAGAAMTNLRGIAQDYWTLGAEPGENIVEVRAVNSWTGKKQVFATFEATGVPVPVHTVTVTPESAELQLIVDMTEQLAVDLTAEDGTVLTGRDVEWSTSDGDVASVGNEGLVTAVAEGTATITATSDNGKFDQTEITVLPAPVTRVGITPLSVDMEVGDEQQLGVTLYDANDNVLTDRDVTWSTNAPGVASVVDGLVTALAEGQATITASSEDVDGTAEVSVSNPEPAFPPDQYEGATGNNTPGDATFLGSVFGAIEDGETESIQANFHDPRTDADDWYRVQAVQRLPAVCNEENFEEFNFTVDLTDIPAETNYDLEVYSGFDPIQLLGSSSSSGNTDERVIAPLEGNCSTRPEVFQVFVRVRHVSGPATAELYTLSMTFDQPPQP